MSFDTSEILNVVEAEISNHMDTQPYRLTCSLCGANLNFECTLDEEYNLFLVVVPCTCQTEKE